MLRLFHQPQQFVLPVTPNSHQQISIKLISEKIQKVDSAIASVEFIGVDSSKIKAKEMLLSNSDSVGFCFYCSNYHSGESFKKIIRIPRNCYAIRLSVKNWNNEAPIYIDGNIEISTINAQDVRSLFSSYVQNRIDKKEPDAIRRAYLNLDDKHQAYSFVRKFGVLPPEIYKRYSSLSDINLEGLPNDFVLKPLWGCAGKGIFVLHKLQKGVWFDSMRQIRVNQNDITRVLEKEFGPQCHKFHYFSEEYLVDDEGYEIPADYKIFAFYDKIGLVQKRYVGANNDKSTWKNRFFDENWNDLGPVRDHNLVDPSLSIPKTANEIVETARLLSIETKLPFIRVDLYNTKSGIRFGEFTPMPGSYMSYCPDTNRMFGNLWKEALVKLKL
ncbi:ATP-grasp fold amidoligase family protein [Aeromonas veronii]|uniref:ATP-grasp fold amidoligase family protein n=1 Tax=Aeromonas veronii TaxID=654 RepID=UPI003F79145D